jgi:hypothetical protein
MDDTYVLIFAFDPEGNVLLRRKKRPDWQHELWNGLGGQGNMEDTAARTRDFNFNDDEGHWPLERYIAVRKFRAEAGPELPPQRLRGNIIVPFPPCTLHVFWVDLTAAEAKCCYQTTNDVDVQVVEQELGKDQEYNHWFDAADVVHMANGDTEIGLVSSTYELICLIQSLRHWFPEQEDA